MEFDINKSAFMLTVGQVLQIKNKCLNQIYLKYKEGTF